MSTKTHGITKLLESEFVIKYLKKNIPELADKYDFSDLTVTQIKDVLRPKSYHIVLRFDSKSIKNMPIFCSAHSHENRENAYKALSFMYDNGFKNTSIFLPKPLFYDNKFKAFFYQGVDGENLLYYIKKENFDITSYLEQASTWLAQLHSIPVTSSENFNPKNSRIKTIVPGPKHFFNSIEKKFPEYLKTIKTHFNNLVEEEEKNLKSIDKLVMIHGDFHPENIIINKTDGKVSAIDFTDMCLADWARDIGNFLQQLRFMASGKISSKEIEAYENFFLSDYMKKRSIKNNSEIEKRIKLYKSWAALRSAIYFLTKVDSEVDNAETVLKEVTKP
jgi:thiamine kinase-like enzyme